MRCTLVEPLARQIRVNFVGGERNQRREHPHQRVENVEQRSLRRAALARFLGRAVEAVARDVDIQRAQIDDDKILHHLERRLEFERVVRAAHLALQFLGAREDEAVELEQVR